MCIRNSDNDKEYDIVMCRKQLDNCLKEMEDIRSQRETYLRKEQFKTAEAEKKQRESERALKDARTENEIDRGNITRITKECKTEKKILLETIHLYYIRLREAYTFILDIVNKHDNIHLYHNIKEIYETLTTNALKGLQYGIETDSKEVLNKLSSTCLLYTSDAADERSSVDLGGRRI